MGVKAILYICAKLEVCGVCGSAQLKQSPYFGLAPLVGPSWEVFEIFDI